MNRALEDYVLKHYVEAATTDVEFARMAEKELGFPITNHNVAGTREMFDIPSTRFAHGTSDADRLTRLERQFAALEQRVQVYIDGCGSDPRSPRSTKP
jgi:glutamate mutase epsilon subunit